MKWPDPLCRRLRRRGRSGTVLLLGIKQWSLYTKYLDHLTRFFSPRDPSYRLKCQPLILCLRDNLVLVLENCLDIIWFWYEKFTTKTLPNSQYVRLLRLIKDILKAVKIFQSPSSIRVTAGINTLSAETFYIRYSTTTRKQVTGIAGSIWIFLTEKKRWLGEVMVMVMVNHYLYQNCHDVLTRPRISYKCYRHSDGYYGPFWLLKGLRQLERRRLFSF